MNWKFLLAFAPALLGYGAAAERITWMVNDFPPAHVLSGERAGTGIVDVEMTYFAQHMTEFTHLTRVTANVRAMMLNKGRVDYAFGYANEITYYRSSHPGVAEMVAIPIAGQPRILYTRIACSDGPIGRRAINRIDQLLGRTGLPPPYFAATRRWYDPEDFRQLSAQAIWTRQEVFNEK